MYLYNLGLPFPVSILVLVYHQPASIIMLIIDQLNHHWSIFSTHHFNTNQSLLNHQLTINKPIIWPQINPLFNHLLTTIWLATILNSPAYQPASPRFTPWLNVPAASLARHPDVRRPIGAVRGSIAPGVSLGCSTGYWGLITSLITTKISIMTENPSLIVTIISIMIQNRINNTV